MTTKNQRGFTHNIALLVLGVLVLGIVGFAGMKVTSKNNGIKAAAASADLRLYIGNSGTYATVYVCKYKNGWWGGTWKLRAQTYNSSTISFTGGGSMSGNAYWMTSAGKLYIPNAAPKSWSNITHSEGYSTEKLIIIMGKPIPEC